MTATLCKYCIVSCPIYPIADISPRSGREIIDLRSSHTLKTGVRNFRVSSSLMEPSSFPYMWNTARAFALSCFPQNVLMPLLVDGGGKRG